MKVYVSVPECFVLHYFKGELIHLGYLKNTDKVLFDGLKHEIQYYEQDINPKYFRSK